MNEDMVRELQLQLARAQAMLGAQQELLMVMFDAMSNKSAVLDAFERSSQITQDLLLIEPEFSDEELANGDVARSLLLAQMRSYVGSVKKE